MTTAADWRRRFYGVSSDYREARKPHDRDHQIAHVAGQVRDLHALGVFVYHDLVRPSVDRGLDWFDGTVESIHRAVNQGHLPKPNRPFPVVAIRQGLLFYSGHTRRRFDAWAESAKSISVGSYYTWLLRECEVRPFRKPATDLLTVESMQNSVTAGRKR